MQVDTSDFKSEILLLIHFEKLHSEPMCVLFVVTKAGRVQHKLPLKTIEEERGKRQRRELKACGQLRDSPQDAAVGRVSSEMDASFALEERH